jgi:signal recognition particle receptor subunit beta
MSFVNFRKKEINFKIVYYGPGRSGKTTNLERIHTMMPDDIKGNMTMLSTQEDRTLYFDFLPLKSNAIPGFTTRFQLYTVPGQPIYDKTRQLVLIGSDGVVFVADSQWEQMENNVLSFEDLKINLKTHNTSLELLPYVLQFNKRDLPNVAPIKYMDFLINQGGTRTTYVDAIATKDIGVDVTLNLICKMVMAKFIKDNNMSPGGLDEASSVAVTETEKSHV